MLRISELRSKLREIRKKLAKNIGYLDFKYLHKMKRPELEALLKKYEKFDIQVNTIQQAIRNKRARNTANSLLNERDRLQVVRDIEQRLIEVQRPQSLPTIIGRDIGLSASSKRSAISSMYEQPRLQILPPVQYRNRLYELAQPRPRSAGSLPLSRIQDRPRPQSAGRTFNKFKPL